MASKGPKTGGVTPAAPKPVARAKKPAAPKPMVAAAETEKPVPVAAAPTPVAPLLAEPAAASEAAPQEVAKTVIEAAPVAAQPIATQAAPAVEAVAEPLKKEASTMEATIENNTVRAQNLFADMNDRTKAAMERSAKMVEEMNDFAKGNLEAVVESSRITAKGLETMGQDAAEYGRKSFEQATAALKQLASVKSPTEFFKLQSDFMRQSFDAYVAEASKNTEAMLKLAGDASQPISNRIAVAADKAKVAA